MRKRKKPAPEWKEIQRKELGLYASGHVSGPGWSNPGYFCIVYEVAEIRARPKGPPEHRFRTEQGPACRLYREGYEAFWRLYLQYVQHAQEHRHGRHNEDFGQCIHRQDLK